MVFKDLACWLVHGDSQISSLISESKIDSAQLVGISAPDHTFTLEVGGQSSFVNYAHCKDVYHQNFLTKKKAQS